MRLPGGPVHTEDNQNVNMWALTPIHQIHLNVSMFIDHAGGYIRNWNTGQEDSVALSEFCIICMHYLLKKVSEAFFTVVNIIK